MEPITTAEDRISQLPDPVLHLILSEDRTRHVVQTMILSKRWKRLWASTPYLFLDDYKDHLGSREGMPNFVDFVNTVLLVRDVSDIHTFCLKWYFSYDQRWLTAWTEYVIRHNVKILEIYLDKRDTDMVKWPSCIFNCHSLEKLTLKLKDSVRIASVVLRPPSFVRLDLLTLLHLEYLAVDQDSLNNLLEGCPVLEELETSKCLLKDLDIFSHTLKRLCIMCSEITGTMVRISCPNVTDFVFLGNDVELREIVFEDFSSLVAANIQTDDCGLRLTFLRAPKPLMFFDSPSEYLLSARISGKEKWQRLGTVTIDKFSFPLSLEKNALMDSGPSEFGKLKNLVLTGDHMNNAQAIFHFLERAPNLELFRLKYLSSWEARAGFRWYYPRPHLDIDLEVQSECGAEDEGIYHMVNDIIDTIDNDREESGESG